MINCLILTYKDHFEIEYKDDIYTPLLKDVEKHENLVSIITEIRGEDNEGIFKLDLFSVDPKELFCLVTRPQELYDGRYVQLTMLERRYFLAPEIKVTFYQYLKTFEPILLEEPLKKGMIKQIIYEFLIKNNKYSNDKIYEIKFKDGYRDLIKVTNNIPIEDFIKIKDIQEYKNINLNKKLNEKLEEIQNDKNKILILLIFNKPNEEKIHEEEIFIEDVLEIKKLAENKEDNDENDGENNNEK